MTIKFRNYTKQSGITEDYHKVREFFINLGYAEFTYARWDWMTTHSSLDRSSVGRIGIWEEDNKIIGVATFDTHLGNAYCLTLPEYAVLKKDMFLYAKDNFAKEDKFNLIILDIDSKFQDIVADNGFIATGEKENDAIFYLDKTSTSYELPDGNFVSYCGMWYGTETDFAVIEPVATDPDYRKMGFGKAAVLEGIRRVGKNGAKKVLVGSSQQFYYSIGLRPFTTSTLWRERKK